MYTSLSLKAQEDTSKDSQRDGITSFQKRRQQLPGTDEYIVEAVSAMQWKLSRFHNCFFSHPTICSDLQAAGVVTNIFSQSAPSTLFLSAMKLGQAIIKETVESYSEFTLLLDVTFGAPGSDADAAPNQINIFKIRLLPGIKGACGFINLFLRMLAPQA